MSDLKKQAEELGIKVDNRWGDDRIQQEIDKALSAEQKAEPFGGKGDHDHDGKPGGSVAKLIPVRVNRDFWDENGERHRKGKIVEVTVDAALDGVETGALSRVKD